MALLLGAALHGSGFALAQTEPSGAGTMPAVPELDVVGSVRRMLEESRAEAQMPAASDAASGTAEPAPGTAHEAVSPQALSPVVTPMAPGTSRDEIRTGAGEPEPPRPAPARANHVPVPVKEITIRSLDDLRTLTEALDRAKAEQARH